jgi:hypothetical protein
MHQANLAEDEKSRQQGGVVITIISVPVSRSRDRPCFAWGGPRFMIIIPSDTDAVPDYHFEIFCFKIISEPW